MNEKREKQTSRCYFCSFVKKPETFNGNNANVLGGEKNKNPETTIIDESIGICIQNKSKRGKGG